MDQELLENLKSELMRRRDELLRSINHELDGLKEDEAHHLADMEDLASDSRNETVSFEILALGQANLSQIQEALEAIAAGSYGLCEECQKPINPERLKALPFATLCIHCKREQETAVD